MVPELALLGYRMSSYGAVVAVYLVVALWLTVYLNRQRGISDGDTLAIFVLAVPAAALGSRALDAVEYWSRYRSFADLVGRQGSSIYGGLLAGFGTALLCAHVRRLSVLDVLDAGSPAVALGEAMTRIGCFLNGCCYGIAWDGPFAVRFPRVSFAFADQVAQGLLPESAPNSVAVHPVQLYSTVAMLGVFAFLIWELRRTRRQGEVFFKLLVAYGAWRLIIAPLRVEALTSMRVFSALFVVAGIIGMYSIHHRIRSSQGPARG